MANSIVDFNSLLTTWNPDCLSQVEFIERLKAALIDTRYYIDNNISNTVQLNQSSEPTQAQWEQAWVSQTGKALPISPSATLLWFDTNNNTFGGQYGTTIGHSTVYRREPIYPKGATIFYDSDFLTSSQTITADITATRALMPTLEFTINQSFDLHLSFTLAVTFSGTGQYGLDFELNGEKIGTTYFGIPANYGIVNGSTTQTITAHAFVPNLPAGNYEIQALFGVVGTPATAPTLTIGGTGSSGLGARLLVARVVSN